MTGSQSSPLIGCQTPRIGHFQGTGPTTGRAVIALAGRCGLRLDQWQQDVIIESHRVSPDGRLATNQVGLVVPRQNGKGSIIEAVELGWLFLSREELVLHSAHEFKTAADAYKRIKSLIQNDPDLESMVAKWNNSHGHEGIELKPDSPGQPYRALKFVARTAGSGRGFPGKKVVLDEAYDLREADLAALIPTLMAADDAQVWYTSSPVNKEFHANGVPLSRLRRRVVDPVTDDKRAVLDEPRLTYFEWSHRKDMPKSEYRSEQRRAEVNPGYGKRLRPDTIQLAYDNMSTASFGAEIMGVGDWPDPDEGSSIISQQQWDELEDTASRIVGKRVFAFDIAPYAEKSSIGVCGKNAAGMFHVEVIETRPGSAWITARLKELCAKWRPWGVVHDPRSASAALESDLIEARLPLIPIKGVEVAAAFAEFHAKVTQTRVLRHPSQPSVLDALDGATTRNIGDALAWSRKDSSVDITGLVSITNALFGFSQKCSSYLDVTESIW